MHILILNSEFPPVGGGAGNASANLARCLSSLGHRVTVLTTGYGETPALEVHGSLTIHRLRGVRRWIDRSSPFEQVLFIVSASMRVISLARHPKPDAVLAFFGVPSGAVAWILKKLYGIPYIVSLRGGDVPGFRPYDFKLFHRLIGPFLRMIWHNASAVVANSAGLRDLALAFEPRLEIPIIPNGVEASSYDAGPRDWNQAALFSAGRVVYQKGLDLGLHALAGLKHLDWQWRIAGDGPQMQPLQALARQLGLADRVTFLGWQAREALPQWYHQSTIFLFPSRHEGMPNAVLEAMASGLPVIASRIAGNEELVIPGQTGLLVEPENIDSLRAGLDILIQGAAQRQKMGSASRARVEKEYSWENSARQYSRLLEDLL